MSIKRGKREKGPIPIQAPDMHIHEIIALREKAGCLLLRFNATGDSIILI